jgi:hypothetical protein
LRVDGKKCGADIYHGTATRDAEFLIFLPLPSKNPKSTLVIRQFSRRHPLTQKVAAGVPPQAVARASRTEPRKRGRYLKVDGINTTAEG